LKHVGLKPALNRSNRVDGSGLSSTGRARTKRTQLAGSDPSWFAAPEPVETDSNHLARAYARRRTRRARRRLRPRPPCARVSSAPPRRGELNSRSVLRRRRRYAAGEVDLYSGRRRRSSAAGGDRRAVAMDRDDSPGGDGGLVGVG
jgi:hypothetical protein